MAPRKPPAKKPAAKAPAKARPAGTVDPRYAKNPTQKAFDARIAQLEAGNAEAKAAFLRAPGATEERWAEVMGMFGSQPVGITGPGGKQRIVGAYDYGSGKAVRGKTAGKAAYQRYRSTVGATGGDLSKATRDPLSLEGGGAGGASGDEKVGLFKEYAEADTTTTSMLRAQGKAYAASRAGRSGSRAGGTTSPEDEALAEEAGEASPGTKSRAKPKKRTVRSKTKSGKKVVRTRKGGQVVKKTVGGKKVPLKKTPPKKKR